MNNYTTRNVQFYATIKPICLIVLLTLCLTNQVSGQNVEVNERGDTIVTYLDGSWRYYKLADSIFLNPRVLGPLPGQLVSDRKKERALQRSKKNNLSNKDRNSDEEKLIDVSQPKKDKIAKSKASNRNKTNKSLIEKPNSIKERGAKRSKKNNKSKKTGQFDTQILADAPSPKKEKNKKTKKRHKSKVNESLNEKPNSIKERGAKRSKKNNKSNEAGQSDTQILADAPLLEKDKNKKTKNRHTNKVNESLDEKPSSKKERSAKRSKKNKKSNEAGQSDAQILADAPLLEKDKNKKTKNRHTNKVNESLDEKPNSKKERGAKRSAKNIKSNKIGHSDSGKLTKVSQPKTGKNGKIKVGNSNKKEESFSELKSNPKNQKSSKTKKNRASKEKLNSISKTKSVSKPNHSGRKSNQKKNKSAKTDKKHEELQIKPNAPNLIIAKNKKIRKLKKEKSKVSNKAEVEIGSSSALYSSSIKVQKSEHKIQIKNLKKEKKSILKSLQTGELNDVLKKINAYYTAQMNSLELSQRESFKLENLIKIVNTQLATTEKNSESHINLKDQIRQLEHSQKENQKRIKLLEKQVAKAKQLTRANESFQKKWLAKYERKNGQIKLEKRILPIETPKVEIVKVDPASNPQKDKSLEREENNRKAKLARYQPVPVIKTDYGYHDCNIAFVGTDKFSNKRRIDVAKQTLFEYTHDELRPYFKDKIYMTCEGFLSAQPGFKYLTLEFTIASDRAKQSFGTLQKGSLLTLKLIDGSFINLINTADDFGTVDLQSKTTVYIGQYVIEKKQERELTNLELDQIRVMWTSGFEDYSIYEMDFLKNQFECLNSEY